MSTFNYDQMIKHEGLAKKALEDGDLKLAFHHLSQETMYAFLLAKGSDKKIAGRYLEKANGLLALARQLKAKIDAAPKAAVAGNGGNGGKESEEGTLFQSVETPKMKFADVAGMDDVKQKFTDMVIAPLKHRDLAEKYHNKCGGGVLMYGPPGTGKTFIARALAGELNAKFYVIKSSDLVSKYVGDTEKRIKELFAEVRRNPLAVIFIDEIDAVTPDRAKGDAKEYDTKMVAALLQELDGFESKDAQNTLLFLGATNRPYSMDSAFLRSGRFGVKIRVGLPDLVCRQKILELFFKSRGWSLSEELLRDAAVRTEGFNSADVDNLAQTVMTLAFKDEVRFREELQKKDEAADEAKGNETEYAPNFKELFEEAFKTVKSSVSQRDLNLLAKWEKENNIVS